MKPTNNFFQFENYSLLFCFESQRQSINFTQYWMTYTFPYREKQRKTGFMKSFMKWKNSKRGKSGSDESPAENTKFLISICGNSSAFYSINLRWVWIKTQIKIKNTSELGIIHMNLLIFIMKISLLLFPFLSFNPTYKTIRDLPNSNKIKFCWIVLSISPMTKKIRLYF